MGLKLVPDHTEFKFTKFRWVAFGVSAVSIVVSIIAYLMIGLNLGIDFKGGIMVEIAPTEGNADFTIADQSKLRDALNALNLGGTKVQKITAIDGGSNGFNVVVEKQPGEGDEGELAQQAALAQMKTAIASVLGEVDYRKEEAVGGAISGELIWAGIYAVGAAVLMMLAYIWFRFEWQFSVGAIIALVHDVVLTIGMFSITGIEFNMSIIAAILTIIGYSMNDTVVVYDRVRENLRKFKRMLLPDVLDLSINNTLSRTILTSVTTLLALGSLLIFGGDVLRGFTAAMIWGVLIGTYSSIFIASPILMITNVKRDWSKNTD